MKKAQIKKSVSALAMAAIIAVSLFGYGCGAKPASTSSDAGVSGDFTGTAKGFGGDVSVTLTLTDGEYAFTVTPEKGGMATSFTKNGDEYLWLRDKNFESTDRPRCGIPILFPNCGKPDDGVHHFNGAAYPIEVHGLADLVSWQVKSADDTAIELTLTLSLIHI